MLTGKEDLLQALIEAFIMEKGTKEFYFQAASKSTTGDARKMFDELAAWETQHMNYVQSLYQSILDDRELEEFSVFSKKVPAPLAEGGIPVKDLEKKMEKYAVRNEQDALSLSLNIEAKSYSFYKDLAKKAQDPGTRVIFEEMMAQETRHLDHLNKMKQKLARN